MIGRIDGKLISQTKGVEVAAYVFFKESIISFLVFIQGIEKLIPE